jgi:prepilin-type N-terminal cleavage/methylation domain-containing protein/prepilin-type processing-associated H-X9-DG protein
MLCIIPGAILMRRQSAFTLIELLVVITVIGVLVAMLLPALGKSRELTRQMVCSTTLRGMIQATVAYTGDSSAGYLPAAQRSPWYHPPGIDTWCLQGSNCIVDLNQTGYIPPGEPVARLAGVGYLMAGKYLAENKKSYMCPQSAYREPNKGYLNNIGALLYVTLDGPTIYDQISCDWTLNPSSGIYYKNAPGTNGILSTYITRGMPQDSKITTLYRFDIAGYYGYPKDKVPDWAFGFYWDHETADWYIRNNLPGVNGGPDFSPVEGWSRVHIQGINTAYMDGHVAMFKDEDRKKTWYGRGAQNFYYGNGNGPCTYDLDQPGL